MTGAPATTEAGRRRSRLGRQVPACCGRSPTGWQGRRCLACRRPPAVVRRRDRMAQFGAADTAGTARPCGRCRLLDIYLHQLAADRPVRPRLGREVSRPRADGDRRPYPRVRLRARIDNVVPRTRDFGVSSRSRSTTTMASGRRSRTTSGRRSTSQTRRAGSATTTSARASTRCPRWSSSSCSSRPAPTSIRAS